MQSHVFLSDLRLLEHETHEHPENATRLQSILEAFASSLYKDFLNMSVNRQATLDEIARVHEIAYINHVLSLDGKSAALDAETLISPGSVKAALLAAGLGLELVERVIQGKAQNGFVLVRPPGHHARPSTGMGFCLFNNISIAVQKALDMGLERILILDWDVHHGNGTQEIFYGDDRVLFIDMHQDNLFPVNSGLIDEIGSGKGLGYTVNIPLPSGCHDGDYLYVFDQIVEPLAQRFRPELILVSAGFDAHESDPLGFMNLTTMGFGLLAEKTRKLAETLCKGRLVLFLEGGYNSYFLAKNVISCVETLLGNSIPQEIIKPPVKSVGTVKEVYGIHFT
jgi:acetoin utilization deacetylase AcuC-like enzyme